MQLSVFILKLLENFISLREIVIIWSIVIPLKLSYRIILDMYSYKYSYAIYDLPF